MLLIVSQYDTLNGAKKHKDIQGIQDVNKKLPPYQYISLLGCFPKLFLKFLTKQVKSKLFGGSWEYTVNSKFKNLQVVWFKRR